MSFKTRFFVSMLLGCVMLMAVPVFAQDGAPDPVDLATRLLDYDGLPAIPEPTPLYSVGDTAQFWVSKVGQDAPVQMTAELAGVGADTYVWVEQGTAYDPASMGEFAAEMSAIYAILRVRDNYGVVNTVPQSLAQLEMMQTLRMPDVDNDPHLYIVYANDLNDNRTSVYNPANSLESNLVPGGVSNQHEMVLVNMTNFPGVELDDAPYTNILARQFYAMLAYYNNPSQPLWLQGATAWDTLLQILDAEIASADVQPFLADPRTPLTLLTSGTGAEFGAQQLFLRYVLQRFGFEVFRDLFRGSGSGLAALDAALSAQNITDLVTGEPITAREVFADFVMANALNTDLGDGRYKHVEPAADGLMAAVLTAEDQFDFDLADQAVSQLGTNYLGLKATQPASFRLFFSGQDNNSRLPMPASEASNHFYWTGKTPNRDATLTRAFDLSGVEAAALTFDAWYSLTDGWNYAYVQVSEDGGQTWDILPASNTTTINPNSLSYGASFTGISNPEKPRPFPYLGVGLDPDDGLTLTEIIDNGPMAGLDIEVGDKIAGYDGKAWEAEQTNLLVFLADYEAGDTINFYMQRGDTFYDAEVTLGSHPVRRKIPDAIWMAQTVDLSAYAGKPILLRFESISLPGNEDLGFAIDNIKIPAINFSDDAESGIPGWTLDGWQQTTNETRQQFLVQAAVVGPDMNTIHVTRLIGPGDSDVSGQWDFTLQADETLLLAISGLNDDTTLPGLYSLGARAAANDVPSTEF